MNKIAIQGHPTRGKEVIQILESLGGINSLALLGTNTDRYYYIYDNNIIMNMFYNTDYKIYTLEEFEKEFPFKIGDKVIHSYTPNFIGKVVDIKFDDHIPYRVNIKEKICTCGTMSLKPYKEMKEERNITLTLDKAKKWYNKGGDLKQVALQAFTEEELTKIELPKTWEEFCENYPVKKGECWIGGQGFINICKTDLDKRECRNWILSKKSAEAHIALMQLEQLRDCYRQGDIPDFNDDNTKKYCIIKIKNDIRIKTTYNTSSFLTFTKEKVAEKFLNNFEPLIKIAEDYI